MTINDYDDDDDNDEDVVLNSSMYHGVVCCEKWRTFEVIAICFGYIHFQNNSLKL